MRRTTRRMFAMTPAIALLAAACGGGAPPTASPAAPSQAASGAPSTGVATPAPSGTNPATGPASLDAPTTVEAGSLIDVAWTGPNGERDYVTIVAPTATEWTDEEYFYTTEGTPGHLTAPSTPGAYVLWYVTGVDREILFRRDISVTPFTGSLLGPETVGGNTKFDVAWNGPDGPGDYITIVKLGATKWSNESYFYTTAGSPGQLLAPLEAGSYELWYVIGGDETIQARAPITVIAATGSVDGPDTVLRNATFDVTWTGPDGPGDYITIVKVGAEKWSNEPYFYTYVGNPGPLTAPDGVGDYELWYVTGQGAHILARAPIAVKQ
jgi:Ca-activated chloride channel homolog